jgi:hypothetical protein
MVLFWLWGHGTLLLAQDENAYGVTTPPKQHAYPLHLPDALSLLRARVTLRLLEDATLPRFKSLS